MFRDITTLGIAGILFGIVYVGVPGVTLHWVFDILGALGLIVLCIFGAKWLMSRGWLNSSL